MATFRPKHVLRLPLRLPKFSRQRFLFSLLQVIDIKLTQIDLQKHSFYSLKQRTKIPQPAQQPFINLVAKIIQNKQTQTKQPKQNNQPTTLETQTDKLVYQLYNLT